GAYDGWFALNNLNAGGDLFNTGIEALLGIMPPGLLANFTANPTSGCAGLKVTFADQTVGQTTPVAWNWSFPGGTPSSFSGKTPPVISYNTPGTFSVTEIVTDNTGAKD